MKNSPETPDSGPENLKELVTKFTNLSPEERQQFLKKQKQILANAKTSTEGQEQIAQTGSTSPEEYTVGYTPPEDPKISTTF